MFNFLWLICGGAEHLSTTINSTPVNSLTRLSQGCDNLVSRYTGASQFHHKFPGMSQINYFLSHFLDSHVKMTYDNRNTIVLSQVWWRYQFKIMVCTVLLNKVPLMVYHM